MSTRILFVALLLAACGRWTPGPQLPTPGPSYLFEDGGGRLVVGLVVERRDPIVLSSLVDPEALDAFLESEAAEDEELPEEIEEIPVEEEPWEYERYEPGWGGGGRRLRNLERALEKETGIELQFRELLAKECAGVPLLLVEKRELHPGEQEALADGGVLLTVEDFTQTESIAAAIREVLAESELVRRLGARPDRLVVSHRDGDRIVAQFAAPPVEVVLKSSDGTTIPGARVLEDGSVTCPTTTAGPGLTRQFLIARWVAGGISIRRSWCLYDLVEEVAFEIRASSKALAGGTWAARVRVHRSGSDKPVAGHIVQARMEREGTVLVSGSTTSDGTGIAEVRLSVPADAEGDTVLVINGVSRSLRIERDVRLSLVTDRALYEPTDTVHARALVFAWPGGVPLEGERVTFKLGDQEQTATTSKHGIASALFALIDARPGGRYLKLTCGERSASTRVRVEAIERPRFTVSAEPASLRLQPGEEAPVTITALMVNGTPLVGAKVKAGRVTGVTDTDGCFELTAKDDLYVRVTDADGRTQRVTIPVETPRQPTVTPLCDLVQGREGRFLISGKPGEHVTVRRGDATVFDGDLDDDGLGRFELTGLENVTLEIGSRQTSFNVVSRGRPMIVPRRRVVSVGERLAVDILDTDGPATLDVFRDGVLLRSREVERTARIAIEPDLVGVLTLRARSDGRACTAQVLVLRDDELTVGLEPDRESYEPGSEAKVDVRVTDRDAKPAAAALGWWAVDEALLALAPMPDGHERVFASLPAAPSEGLRKTAYSRRFLDAKDALGDLEWGRFEPFDGEFVLHSTDAMKAQIAREARDAFKAHAKKLRSEVLAAFGRIPVRELRSASSLRDRLDDFVARGALDPDLLLDPWGTPMVLWRVDERRDWYFVEGEHDANPLWLSSGPDLEFGTGDDARVDWWFEGFVDELPGHVRRYLFWLMDHADPMELQSLGVRSLNGVIGLLGGAGGGFRGRGGRRNLRVFGGGALAEPPARTDFRPTLKFVAEQLTDEQGRATLVVPLADSITAWKLRVVASTLSGAVGIGETRLVSSKPLYAEPRIAPHLTVGDELELPVAVRNETDSEFEAHVGLSLGEGLTGAAEAGLVVQPGRTAAHLFRIKAIRPGKWKVRIDARGGEHSDAVERIVTVHRDGRRIETTLHGRVRPETPWRASVDRPGVAALTLYPSALADLKGSYEGLIREPHGCFEQTSSTLYPMILALELMRREGTGEGSFEDQALGFINKGYRKLMGYEVPGSPGGFSLFGKPPANVWLTAYGLMEFTDLKRVYPVDETLIPRVVEFLRKSQNENGSWGDFNLTAWCALALREAGEKPGAEIDWLTEQVEKIEDPRGLALAALVLDDKRVRGRLKSLQGPKGNWLARRATALGARGMSASIEATALAMRALSDVRGLQWLAEQRDGSGRFGTTQSTVQALKTLLAADTGEPASGRVIVRAGARTLATADLGEEPIRLDLGLLAAGELTVELAGEGSLRATLSLASFASWDEPTPTGGRTALEVTWPDRRLQPGEEAVAVAVIRNPSRHPARVVTAEIGLPPGCDVDRRAVRGDESEAIEKGPRAIVIYLDDLGPGEERRFEIPFTPRHELDVQTAPSRVYEYYVPEETLWVAPVRVTAAAPK